MTNVPKPSIRPVLLDIIAPYPMKNLKTHCYCSGTMTLILTTHSKMTVGILCSIFATDDIATMPIPALLKMTMLIILIMGDFTFN